MKRTAIISSAFLVTTFLTSMTDPSVASTCAVTALQVKDNAATTANVPYSDTGDGSGNCEPGIKVLNTNNNGQAAMSASSPVTLAGTTASVQLVALSGSTKIYVCSLALIGSTATVFSVIGGTGSACGTSAVAIMGSSTATNGMSLALNGGLTLGNGNGTVASTAAGSELCLVQSGAGNISGNLGVVQQ